MHTGKATAANVHDVSMTPELLHGEEETINGDSGYVGAEKRKDALARNKKGKKICHTDGTRLMLASYA